MTPSHTAQGLASLGRNGDSMLVHMSPEEVGGLKQVGNSLGIKMSTNPQTGMPEAFSFGDFFTSFLPTIVGAAVGGPAGAGFMSSTMTPILAGAGTGALLAAAKGDDPLMGGLTGGFGGYGGSQLGQSFGKAFGSTGGTTAESFGKLANEGAEQIMGGGMTGNISPFGSVAPNFNPNNIVSSFNLADDAVIAAGQKFPNYSPVSPGAGTVTSSALPPLQEPVNIATAPDFSPIPGATQGTGGYTTALDIGQNLGDFGTGVKNLSGFGDMSISDAYGKFTKAGGTAADLAMPVGGAVLSGLEPSDLGYGVGNLYDDPDKGKYKGPQGQLNLSDRFDTGLRLAMGGTVQSGGIRDLYGTPDNPPAMSSGLGGFGLGRLNDLASEQARSQAQTLGYADGGDVGESLGGGAVDESAPNPEGVVSKYTTVIDDKGVASRVRVPYQYEKIITKGAEDFYDIPPLEYAANLYPGSVLPKFKKEQMAKGGYLNGQGDGMSDSIPATIEGKQPARLADGEFVIPADVVSHLGNGSSKAGSKRLYAMLYKVRQARTGNKKQGKEIKAEKYLPA